MFESKIVNILIGPRSGEITLKQRRVFSLDTGNIFRDAFPFLGNWNWKKTVITGEPEHMVIPGFTVYDFGLPTNHSEYLYAVAFESPDRLLYYYLFDKKPTMLELVVFAEAVTKGSRGQIWTR